MAASFPIPQEKMKEFWPSLFPSSPLSRGHSFLGLFFSGPSCDFLLRAMTRGRCVYNFSPFSRTPRMLIADYVCRRRCRGRFSLVRRNPSLPVSRWLAQFSPAFLLLDLMQERLVWKGPAPWFFPFFLLCFFVAVPAPVFSPWGELGSCRGFSQPACRELCHFVSLSRPWRTLEATPLADPCAFPVFFFVDPCHPHV